MDHEGCHRTRVADHLGRVDSSDAGAGGGSGHSNRPLLEGRGVSGTSDFQGRNAPDGQPRPGRTRQAPINHRTHGEADAERTLRGRVLELRFLGALLRALPPAPYRQLLLRVRATGGDVARVRPLRGRIPALYPVHRAKRAQGPTSGAATAGRVAVTRGLALEGRGRGVVREAHPALRTLTPYSFFVRSSVSFFLLLFFVSLVIYIYIFYFFLSPSSFYIYIFFLVSYFFFNLICVPSFVSPLIVYRFRCEFV